VSGRRRRQAALDITRSAGVAADLNGYQAYLVEGWSYIGGSGGPTLRAFLEHVGAALRAKYVGLQDGR
jgi:hypothetical protein